MITAEPSGQNYDVIIVGGGIAGILTATRLLLNHPNKSFLILEQSPYAGGRLKSSIPNENIWATGMSAMTDKLLSFITNTLHAFPEACDSQKWLNARRDTLGILSANQLSTCLLSEFMEPQSASLLGGAPAAREWQKLTHILENHEHEALDQPFNKIWKGDTKNPAIIVCQHFARLMGIPDLWTATIASLKSRASYIRQASHYGQLQNLATHLVELGQQVGRIDLVTSCRVIEGFYQDLSWFCQTEKGKFKSSILIVAQPPWQTIGWLEQRQIPINILNISLKSKPVSIVTLSEQLLEPCKLPDITLFAAEQVEIFHNRSSDLCFQATIDYELSFDAPSVEKAIRRLRRAHKKLHQFLGEQTTKGEHIALLPAAWPNSPHYSERRLMHKLSKEDIFSPHLCFVGDAYGASYNPEDNLLDSLLKTCELVTNQLHGQLTSK